jgi:hypothetical protein
MPICPKAMARKPAIPSQKRSLNEPRALSYEQPKLRFISFSFRAGRRRTEAPRRLLSAVWGGEAENERGICSYRSLLGAISLARNSRLEARSF